MTESDLSARKKFSYKFFWNRLFWTSDDRKDIKHFFFRTVRVLSVIFSNFFFRFLWLRWALIDSSLTEILINNEISLHQPGYTGRLFWDTSASRMNSDIGRAIFLKSRRKKRTPDEGGLSLYHEPWYQALSKDRFQPRNLLSLYPSLPKFRNGGCPKKFWIPNFLERAGHKKLKDF